MDRSVGYVFRTEDALKYDEWARTSQGRSALSIEQELLLNLWKPLTPQRVLEVGCGTGLFLERFFQEGHILTGIDPSPPMLEVARSRLAPRVALLQGFAEDLPFDDNEFDTVALIATLEYVNNPVKALREAFRVARQHVLLGAANRYSIETFRLYAERFWKRTYQNHARFYSVFRLRRLVEQALAGSVPVRWGTCLSFPLGALRYVHFLERSRLLHWHPFGHFIGMRVDLVYPMQTIQTPLFTRMVPGMDRTRARASCWRSGTGENGRKHLLPGNGPAILPKRNQWHSPAGHPIADG